MREVHVSKIWEKVRNDHPEIRLTEDGNHPTVAGSYLVALAVYASISGRTFPIRRRASARATPPRSGKLSRI
jgi:hypothetical protein